MSVKIILKDTNECTSFLIVKLFLFCNTSLNSSLVFLIQSNFDSKSANPVIAKGLANLAAFLSSKARNVLEFG